MAAERRQQQQRRDAAEAQRRATVVRESHAMWVRVTQQRFNATHRGGHQRAAQPWASGDGAPSDGAYCRTGATPIHPPQERQLFCASEASESADARPSSARARHSCLYRSPLFRKEAHPSCSAALRQVQYILHIIYIHPPAPLHPHGPSYYWGGCAETWSVRPIVVN